MIPVDRNTIMIGLLVVSIAGSLYLLSELRKTQDQVAMCESFNSDVKQVLTAPPRVVETKPPPTEKPTAGDSEE